MNAERTPSCEERLPEQLEGRLADMRSMTGWYDAWSRSNHSQRQETAEERMQDYPLALTVERKITVKLELSYGGPQDYITAEIEDGRLHDVEYHFLDWFDGAKRTLTGDEKATVENYISRLIDIDSPESYIREDG